MSERIYATTLVKSEAVFSILEINQFMERPRFYPRLTYNCKDYVLAREKDTNLMFFTDSAEDLGLWAKKLGQAEMMIRFFVNPKVITHFYHDDYFTKPLEE